MSEKQLINTDPIWGLLESTDWMTKLFGFFVLIVILAFLTGNGKRLLTGIGTGSVALFRWITKRGKPDSFLESARWPFDSMKIVLYAPKQLSYENEDTREFLDNIKFLFRTFRRMQFSGKLVEISFLRTEWVSEEFRNMLTELIVYHAKRNVIKLTFVFPTKMVTSVKELSEQVVISATESEAKSFQVKKEAVKK